MTTVEIAQMLVDHLVSAAAISTLASKVGAGDVVAEYYAAIPEATPEDSVNEVVKEYEAELDRDWVRQAAERV